MSDANRVALRYVEESVFGTTPATPAFQEFRYTSSSLAYAPNTVTSDEIRSDRQITDLALVGFESSGNTNHELSFDAFHDLFEGAFFNDWTEKPVVKNASSDTPISDVSATQITLGAACTSFKTGHLCLMTGFGTSANNKLAKCTADGATNAITFAAATFTAEAVVPAGARVKIVGFQGVAGDLDAATGPNRLTSTTLDFTTLGLSVGEWVKLGGSGVNDKFLVTAGCNGWARISAISANALTFSVVPTGWAASAETTSTLMVFFGDILRNGIVEKSYSLELEYAGMAVTEWEYYTGMEVNSLAFTADAQAIMNLEFGFMGKSASVSGSRFAGATTLAAASNEVMNTSSNVGSIREGDSEVSTPNFVMSMSLTIENNLRMRNAIGSAAAIGIGVGRANVTGEIQTYFGSTALLAKLRANTASSIDFRVNDPTGTKAYIFDMPRVKYQSGAPEVQGIDTDIMLNLGFQAVRDPTLGYTIQLQRFEYLQ